MIENEKLQFDEHLRPVCHFGAVTEMEIQQGLLSLQDASKHCLCFMRNITNLEDHMASRRAQKYLDTNRLNDQIKVQQLFV